MRKLTAFSVTAALALAAVCAGAPSASAAPNPHHTPRLVMRVHVVSPELIDVTVTGVSQWAATRTLAEWAGLDPFGMYLSLRWSSGRGWGSQFSPGRFFVHPNWRWDLHLDNPGHHPELWWHLELVSGSPANADLPFGQATILTRSGVAHFPLKVRSKGAKR